MVVVPYLAIQKAGENEIVKKLYEKIKDEYPDFLKKDFAFKEVELEMRIPMYKELPSYHYIMEFIKKYKFHTRLYEVYYCSKKEKEKGEYFEMWIPSALELEGTDAAYYGTRYNSDCETCNIGGTPVGDVLVDRKFIKKYSIASLKPDIIVSKKVKELIEENNFTGVSFNHVVKDYKGREIPEYYCMTINNVLPNADKKTIFDVNPPAYECKQCGKVVPYILSPLYYKKSDLSNALDFNLTSEYVNNFKEQLIIVSKRVRDVFKKNRIRAGYDILVMSDSDDGEVHPI